MRKITKKKYFKRNLVLSIILIINIIIIGVLIYLLSPVSKNNKDVEFVVPEGASLLQIGRSLKEEGLIKSEKFFLGYTILTNKRNIYAATYTLNDNMKLSDIVDTLDTGGVNSEEITITFNEGLNIRQIAGIISEETNNSYDEVIALANDETYINELINKYWFITKDIKNNNIYYSLEGYLYPDSYNFSSKDVTVREIFDAMIAHMAENLEKYQDDFEKSDYSIHEVMTLASIVELEVTENSRKDIAGLFYNRLEANMSLGSDPTSYYGAQKDMDAELSQAEYDEVNAYNTRAAGMEGKLPAGPICNPSLNAIEAVLNPSTHDYYYFVTDRNGKVYLTKDYDNHTKVIENLKSEGLWLEW